MTALSPALLARKSAAACDRLCASPEFHQASTIMIFLSIDNEIRTDAALRVALEHGKRVLVPHVIWQTRRMIPVRLQGLTDHMLTDKYGLRYPDRGRVVPVTDIDFLVVPGLGFDFRGNRLGRGGGFYDRFIAEGGFRGRVCGFALSDQVAPQIPVEGHDMTVDMLVTDEEVRYFASRRQAVS